jgi:rsbT antagonist protein RsbS
VPVSILKQRDYLIASIQSNLTDTEVVELRDALIEQVIRHRTRGVIVDVAALDVIDSFVSRSLTTVARTNRLRGARTVVVGIQPDVAAAMSQFGLELDGIETALDLEAGLELLDT